MPNLILVHRGNHQEGNPIDGEGVRIGENLRRLVEQNGISLHMARIMAVSDDEISQDTAFGIRAVNPTSDTFKNVWDVPSIEIFSALPGTPNNLVSDYTILVTDAIESIRCKIASLGGNIPLVIVGSLPPVWGIAQRLGNDSLPEFKKENYRDAVSAIPKGAIYLQEL